MVKLTSIITKTGDKGTTGLADGSRRLKSDQRIEAYGSVDEANSALGVARSLLEDKVHDDLLKRIQNDLFNLGADLATPDREKSTLGVEDADIENLEQAASVLNEHLPPLDSFILPAGSQASAALHLARTITRRAERRCVALAQEEDVAEAAVRYLNRLSDLLFILARSVADKDGGEEKWEPKKNKDAGKGAGKNITSVSKQALLALFFAGALDTAAFAIEKDEEEEINFSEDWEFALGAHYHGITEIDKPGREQGAGINAELQAPALLKDSWGSKYLRWRFGGAFSVQQKTHFFYTGFGFEFSKFIEPFFVAFGLDVALHTGPLRGDPNDPGRNAFGCRWAFHESIGVGVELVENHRFMVNLQHISNARKIFRGCAANQGLSHLGGRYSYRF